MSIEILLAEDHTIVRKGLLSLLEAEPDMHVIGEAENGRETVEKVIELEPDIVVMDISMPKLNGLDATRHIKKQCPDIKILVLTMHSNEEYIFEILKAGASGYVLKKAAPTELITAIKAVYRGEIFLSPGVSKTVVQEYLTKAAKDKAPTSLLTEREREILQLIAEGHSNREIAQMLHISTKTVDTHRTHIIEKCDLHSTAELTRYAIRIGLVKA